MTGYTEITKMRRGFLRWILIARARAPSNNQRNIVVLLMSVEAAHFIDYGCNGGPRRLFAIPAESFNQALLAEFFAAFVK
jgi:hypothetical protein